MTTNAEDMPVDSPHALVLALMDAFSNPEGEGCDWARVESLLCADCRFGIASSDAGFTSLDLPELKQFVKDNMGDFRETELWWKGISYSDIAHIWNASHVTLTAGGEFTAANSFQVVREDNQYKLYSLVFQVEEPGKPLIEPQV